MSTAKYGQSGGHFKAHHAAGATKRAAEEEERQRRKGHNVKTVVEKGFQGFTTEKKAPRLAPGLDLGAVVSDDDVVVNENSTDEAYDPKAELEALPDTDLATMAMKLPNFKESWTRKDFIRELLK